MTTELAKTIETPLGQVCFYVSSSEPDQPTALLWPSLFVSGHAAWGPQLDTLHKLGFRTIVVDPPGHGRSGPPPAGFTIAQCSDVALQILDSEGVERAAFLGVSWGGMVAMKTAAVAPHRVTALVLSNTSAQCGTAMEKFSASISCHLIRIGLPGGVGRLIVAGLLGTKFRESQPAFTTRLTGEVNALNRGALARAARSVLVNREDLSVEVAGISAPTLVVTGACDTALPPRHGERIAGAISGARYEMLADVAHVAPREAALAFIGLLESFLGASSPIEQIPSGAPA